VRTQGYLGGVQAGGCNAVGGRSTWFPTLLHFLHGPDQFLILLYLIIEHFSGYVHLLLIAHNRDLGLAISAIRIDIQLGQRTAPDLLDEFATASIQFVGQSLGNLKFHLDHWCSLNLLDQQDSSCFDGIGNTANVAEFVTTVFVPRG